MMRIAVVVALAVLFTGAFGVGLFLGAQAHQAWERWWER